MKGIFRNVLIGLFTLVFASSQSLVNLYAKTSYPVEATPKIQVKVAVGSTTLNETTFLDDLKDALVRVVSISVYWI